MARWREMTEPHQLGWVGSKWFTVLKKVPGPLKGKQLKLIIMMMKMMMMIVIIIKCQSLIDCFSSLPFRREIIKD